MHLTALFVNNEIHRHGTDGNIKMDLRETVEDADWRCIWPRIRTSGRLL
jgi:hypothetical protein